MVKALTRSARRLARRPRRRAGGDQGEGRAFSAGGDILDIYEAGRAGKPPVDFFADEYRLNAAIARFGKPYVALIDGIVMGGGVGVSFHGSHRVLTENAQFAMPEVGIGFFPDVGGSHLLPDLGGSFGMYLGLTGNRIRYGDALWSGLATHTMEARYQAGLLERLAETGDAGSGAARGVPGSAARDRRRRRCTRSPGISRWRSLRDIVASLERRRPADAFAAGDAGHDARSVADQPRTSPSARSAAGSTLSMDECMRMEFRILNRMLRGHDFYEGIRAAIIDKGDHAATGGRPRSMRSTRRHRALFRAARRAGDSCCERSPN